MACKKLWPEKLFFVKHPYLQTAVFACFQYDRDLWGISMGPPMASPGFHCGLLGGEDTGTVAGKEMFLTHCGLGDVAVISNVYNSDWTWGLPPAINTLRPRQNGRHFPDDIFKWIFLNENVWILTNILLKFVPRGPINNTPTLVQIMAWRRPGDKPLSETMMARLPTCICVTRPQWVKDHWYAVFTKIFYYIESNRPIPQIPQCTSPISHNAPFTTEMYTFMFWMVHCGTWDWCTVGFENVFYFRQTDRLIFITYLLCVMLGNNFFSTFCEHFGRVVTVTRLQDICVVPEVKTPLVFLRSRKFNPLTTGSFWSKCSALRMLMPWC